MTTEPDTATTRNVYDLTCTDCEFEATVEGSVHDALDEARRHRTENEETYTEHFVEFEIVAPAE